MKRTLLSRKAAQGGFTLVEFIIVVALIIGGSILVFNYSASAKVSAHVQAESGNIGAINGRIKNMFVSRPNYATLDNTLLIAAKAFPSNMVNDPSTPATGVNNVWGGTVTVAPASVNAGTNNGYTFTYAKVPQAECVDLVSAMDSVFVILNVDGTDVKPFGGTLDQSSLATQCATGDDNTIVFTAI
jgi:type II secretory pathway pseudopilin PulG